MSATTAPDDLQATDPVTLILDGIGARMRAQYRNHNCTIGRSATVHAVDVDTWMAGVELPVPACHVGVAGWRLDRMAPTGRPVSCLRCQRSIPAHRAAPHARSEQLQLALA